MARILIVDDDPGTQVFLHLLLAQEMEHEVLFAEDGEAGLARYRSSQPDIVIADLVMPRLDGVAMIGLLRAVYATARIIAITGRSTDQLEKARAAGAFATFQKPIDQDELLQTIEKAMEANDRWRG